MTILKLLPVCLRYLLGNGPKPHFRKSPIALSGIVLAVIVLSLIGAACTSTPTPTTVPASTTVELPTSSTPETSAAEGETTPTTPLLTQEIPSSEVKLTADIPRDISIQPPDRDLYELARALAIKSDEPINKVVNPEPVSYPKGHTDTFWVTDLDKIRTFTVKATLQWVSPHAYWYVEDGLRVDQRDLERSAGVFEEGIYPRVTAVFGTEWVPGVDNDPHLTILHARIPKVAGYYSSSDEYPVSVHEYSNQREMIYINIGVLRVGSILYLGVLAHELQHAIHWNHDPTEETWVNEGLSEVATKIANFNPIGPRSFTTFPTISLVHWPFKPSVNTSPHYGSAFTFFDYLASHYGPRERLGELINEQADGIAGIDSYLIRRGFGVTFKDVFRDWVVANLVDLDDGGPYSHPGNNVNVRVSNFIDSYGQREFSLPEYAAHYTELDFREGDLKVTFQGHKTTPLLPIALEGQGCWWGNRGDSISSSLTRPVDLTQVSIATLAFQLWFEVEKDWDYGYVQVSTDGGTTWDIIETPSSSPRNPVGNSFGPGYTGNSDGWIEEKVDLTMYAGRKVLLRFQYLTDEAINGTGLCVDRIAIPEIGFSDATSGYGGWQVEGFVRTDNLVPQEYIVQVVEEGDGLRVRQMALDGDNRGEILIQGMERFDRVVVVVAALAPKTTQNASFALAVEPAS